jgi:hypothetical protein
MEQKAATNIDIRVVIDRLKKNYDKNIEERLINVYQLGNISVACIFPNI